MTEKNSGEIEMLKAANTGLKEVIEEKVQESVELREENIRLRKENENLKSRIQELENRIEIQKNSNNKIRAENKRLKSRNKNFVNTVKVQKAASIELRKEIQRLKKEIILYIEKNDELENNFMKLKEVNSQLQHRFNGIELEYNPKKGNIYGSLHQELKELVKTAHEIHNICFEKIRNCYSNKEITLPIDIESVARKLDVDIEYDNLNFAGQRRIDQNIAQLYYEISGDTVKRKIIVDNSTRSRKSESLSNLEKYAVAYELGKIIIGNEENVKPERVRKMNLESRPYSLPRLSARVENFEYEMCAIFLLLPIELFFKEFQNYLNEIKDHPVLMDLWIEHLSKKADIPGYQLINGYQYIKFSAYQYFEMHLSQKIDGTDYRMLYNV